MKPKYAYALLSGNKTVEFRRTTFRRRVDSAYIYATSPIGQVIGVLDITRVVPGTPEELWNWFGGLGGIGREEYGKYYDGCSIGYALLVGNPRRLEPGIPLAQFADSSRPPQSFMYLMPDASNLPKQLSFAL